jgi:hypothetical protein
MKIWTAIVLATASSGVACAQSTEHTHEIFVSGSEARQDYPASLGNMWYEEFEKVKGTYFFESGKSMHLSMWGNRMYVEIEGMNRFPLVALSPYVFLTRNQQVKITIENPDASSGDICATVVSSTSFLPGLAHTDELVTFFAHR